MRISQLEGFESYGGGFAISRPRWSALKVSDECSYIGPGLTLTVDRMPNGKWQLIANGVEMIFDRRPEFTIPQKD